MNYADPRLRDMLAGEYVMATLPRRARARFERLMAADPALARLVGEWQERLMPLDATADPVAPPPQIWRAIESATGAAVVAAARPERRGGSHSWWNFLPLWRGLAFGAMAAAAALALFVVVSRPPTPGQAIIAVLADLSGAPSWLAAGRSDSGIEVAAIRPQAIAADRAFELWAIAGGPPRSLGLLPPSPGERLVLPAGSVPRDGVLAISLEPQGGSRTGAPTGPVVYQGKILPTAL